MLLAVLLLLLLVLVLGVLRLLLPPAIVLLRIVRCVGVGGGRMATRTVARFRGRPSRLLNPLSLPTLPIFAFLLVTGCMRGCV
jgi:hypothetical protein